TRLTATINSEALLMKAIFLSSFLTALLFTVPALLMLRRLKSSVDYQTWLLSISTRVRPSDRIFGNSWKKSLSSDSTTQTDAYVSSEHLDHSPWVIFMRPVRAINGVIMPGLYTITPGSNENPDAPSPSSSPK